MRTLSIEWTQVRFELTTSALQVRRIPINATGPKKSLHWSTTALPIWIALCGYGLSPPNSPA